jgi:hypothetical protein
VSPYDPGSLQVKVRVQAHAAVSDGSASTPASSGSTAARSAAWPTWWRPGRCSSSRPRRLPRAGRDAEAPSTSVRRRVRTAGGLPSVHVRSPSRILLSKRAG